MILQQGAAFAPRRSMSIPTVIGNSLQIGLNGNIATQNGDFVICWAARTSSTLQAAPTGWTDLGSTWANPSLLGLSICGRVADGTTIVDPYGRETDLHGLVQVRGGGFALSTAYCAVTEHSTTENLIAWAAGRSDARLTVQFAVARETQTSLAVLQATNALLLDEHNGEFLDARLCYFAGVMPASSKVPSPGSAAITFVASFT